MELKDIEIAPIGLYGSNEKENKRWKENAEKYREIIIKHKLKGELDNASSFSNDVLLKSILFQCCQLLAQRVIDGESSIYITCYDKEYCDKHGRNPTFDLLEGLYVVSNKNFKEVNYE